MDGECQKANGQFRDCTPIRNTTGGAVCSFPFEYNGSNYTDCTEIDGTQQCRTAKGNLEQCAGVSTGTSGGSSIGGEIISRVTVDDDICVFPFWQDGFSVAECVDVNGTESCMTVAGMKECAPVMITEAGLPCSFPFVDDDGQSQTKCIDRSGTRMCKTGDGSWDECSEELAPRNVKAEAAVLLPGRVTVDGGSCAFPFTYRVRKTL